MSRTPAAAANPPDDRSRELDKFLIAHGGPSTTCSSGSACCTNGR